jgi:epoxyqueuosine reductase QueG
MRREILKQFGGSIEAIGFAPVERFADAPDQHHPSRICKDAKTVIVLGKAVPRGMLHSPDYNLFIMHRSYHSIYPRLDDLALTLANWIEAQGKYLAVPIPSYAPMVFHGREPWGVLSLKHAAVNAGLGKFGKNGLVHHPTYGTLLRLAAVVTDAEIQPDAVMTGSPCPKKCNACLKACPAQAFEESGAFQKMTCLAHTIKHAIYPIAFQTPEGIKHIERVVNTAGHNYWLTCHTCLKVCPSNQGKRPKPREAH